jgi:signal transduction histidine kinase
MAPLLVVVGFGMLALAGCCYCVTGVSAYRTAEPGTSTLSAALLLLGFGTVSGAAARFQPWSTGLADVWFVAPTFALTVGVVPWLLFALHYTGNGGMLTRSRIAVGSALPVVAIVAAVVQVSVPALQMGPTGTVLQVISSLLLVYMLFVFAAATLLLLYATYSYDTIRFRNGVSLWLPFGAPLLLVSVFPTTMGLSIGIPLLVGLCVGAVGVTLAVTVYDAFDTTPAAGRFGRRRLADEIRDPVAFLDAGGDVIETNDAFEEQFEVTESEATGHPLPALVGATLSDLVSTDSIELITDEGRRQFAPRVTELTDHHERNRGTIVLLPDITDQKLREQRLAVLNRVVRHNLRNELSVVRGFAQEIGGDGVPDDVAVDNIVDAADNLITLGERAREAAQLLDHEPGTKRIDLADFVAEIAGDLYDERANLTVETDVPDDAEIETDPELLYRTLSHLAHNAVVHNDADEPRVELSVTMDRDGVYPVEVAVIDNGPGIPSHEWTAIEQGEETPLEHGSGLGLWAVRWAVTRLGGELIYESNEPRGSIVRVRVPVVEDREPSVATEPTASALVEQI